MTEPSESYSLDGIRRILVKEARVEPLLLVFIRGYLEDENTWEEAATELALGLLCRCRSLEKQLTDRRNWGFKEN